MLDFPDSTPYEIPCPNADYDDYCSYCPHYEVKLDAELFYELRADYIRHNDERRALANTLQRTRESVVRILEFVKPLISEEAMRKLDKIVETAR